MECEKGTEVELQACNDTTICRKYSICCCYAHLSLISATGVSDMCSEVPHKGSAVPLILAKNLRQNYNPYLFNCELCLCDFRVNRLRGLTSSP